MSELTCPPPIMTRVFNEISNGSVAHHRAMAISRIPFPKIYIQTCSCLVLLSSLIQAFFMHTFVNHALASFVFSFVQTLFMWSLIFTAGELDNPFGADDNDLNLPIMQRQMNKRLALLLKHKARRTPSLDIAIPCDRRHSIPTTVALAELERGSASPRTPDHHGSVDKWNRNKNSEASSSSLARSCNSAGLVV